MMRWFQDKSSTHTHTQKHTLNNSLQLKYKHEFFPNLNNAIDKNLYFSL